MKRLTKGCLIIAGIALLICVSARNYFNHPHFAGSEPVSVMVTVNDPAFSTNAYEINITDAASCKALLTGLEKAWFILGYNKGEGALKIHYTNGKTYRIEFAKSLHGRCLLNHHGLFFMTSRDFIDVMARAGIATNWDEGSYRKSPEAPTQGSSVEQRVSDLEAFANSKSPPVNDAAAKQEYEKDLAEIRSLGLVDRAEHDFAAHTTNVTIDSRRIGYFVDTNVVWCDYWYRLPGSDEKLKQEFGYSRKGTNWSLIWGVGGESK